jgi:hypothetical protein
VKTKSRTEVFIEIHKRLVIRSCHGNFNEWCQPCAAYVRMLTPEDAAALTKTSPRAIYRKIENGELHFIEREKELILICFNSLKMKDVLRNR